MADDAQTPGVEEIERSILAAVAADGQVADSWAFAREKGWDHLAVVGAIKSLESDEFVTTGKVEFKYWMLLAEGEEALEHGAPEVRFMKALPAEGVAQADMASVIGPFAKLGYGQCMKRRWVRMDKATKTVTPVEGVEVVDDVQPLLAKLHEAGGSLAVVPDSKDCPEARVLKSRKLAKVATRKSFRVNKGPHFALERKKKVADLTQAMLEDGSWQGQEFKDYNFEALGQDVEGGYLHPLLRVRAEFRSILLEMGFEEMPTNQFVESCFRNFDALFQPQSHPARDAHDTFFIKDPSRTLRVPEEYLRSVADIHSNGGHGSTGYNYDWSREEAMKNILRTHTTAISAKMLHRLGQVRRPAPRRAAPRPPTPPRHRARCRSTRGRVCSLPRSISALTGCSATRPRTRPTWPSFTRSSSSWRTAV